jgi:Domain of unknown function (DUF3520)/von Willebrand factor
MTAPTQGDIAMSNLNEFRLDSDDPRLTAYALGELEGEELAQVVAAVSADASLRTAVDEIRATASQLTAALNAEPLPVPVRPVHLEPYHTVRPARMFPFPYWAVAGLAAAACFAVFVVVRQLPFSHRDPRQKTRQLAENEGAAKKTTGGQVAGQQAGKNLEILLPPVEDDASATSGNPASQWGVVVPNVPSAAAQETAGTEVAASGGTLTVAKSAGADAAGALMDHAFLPSAQNPLSAFPLDVGTSGYPDVRRFLLDGRRPPSAVVRLEELVNYFTYDYAAPRPEGKEPLAASLEVASAPWAPLHRLVRIALKARERPPGERPGVVARNVAVQVEFNPAQVQAYRLLGYENPRPVQVKQENDKGDTLDIVSGHTVTAFYEVVPASGDRSAETGDRMAENGEWRMETGDRKDGLAVSLASGIRPPVSSGLLTVRIRYQVPDDTENRLLELPLADRGAAFADASSDFRFAAAVAEFGLVLRDSPYKSGATLADVLHWAVPAIGADPGGARSEFISLVKRAETILPAQG